jgi:Fic family protein
MNLARSEGSSQRFYSMSAQIREERSEYYGILEKTPFRIAVKRSGCGF